MPFVPTPAAFFSAAGGVVIRRTFSAGAGRRWLESAAQFSTGCIVIGGTVCRAASFIQVVILHTIPGRQRWNPPHSLRRAGLLSAAQFLCGAQRGAKKFRLLSGAQFRLFSAGGRLLSTAQFARCGKLIIVIGSTIRILGGFPKVSKPGCYPAHISVSGVVIERTVSKL